jgi:hypothetical protein
MDAQHAARHGRLLVAVALALLLAGPAVDAGARRFAGSTRADRISGTARADRILLGAGNDLARAGAGNDVVLGGRGADRLFGGLGADRLLGDAGGDQLVGEAGRDGLFGGTGSDRLAGGAANDRLSGGTGNDRLAGDAGNDTASGDAGNDVVGGGAGNDRLLGAIGNDTLSGQAGADVLLGHAGNDLVAGGVGADSLTGGVGADNHIGEAGDDRIDARDGRRDTRVDGGAGRDTCLVDTLDLPVVAACEVVQSGAPPPSAGTGGAGGGGATFVPFSLTSATGTGCALLTQCNLRLAGRGAKGGAVTVEHGAEFVGSPTATVAADGTWVVSGTYACLRDTTATLRSGGEQITVAITCATPGPPGGTNNGPLAITSVTGSTCSLLTTTCVFTITGTGAEQAVLAAITGAVLPNAAVAQADAAGNWTLTSPWTCLLPGSATVTIGDGGNEVPPEQVTTTLTCT